jgi:hypothetical protein
MFLTALLACLVTQARANASVFGSYIVGGNACNNGNTQVIDNGNTLSVIFDSFGVNMPQGDYGDGTSVRKTCTFRVQLTPPSGFYLAGFKQLYSGGLIKSRRASAQLNIRYNIGTIVGSPLPIIWGEGSEIRPEDSASLFSRTYNNDLLVASCGGSTNYGINMQFTGTRRNTFGEYLVGGLDSVDATFAQKVVLIPEWRLCH